MLFVLYSIPQQSIRTDKHSSRNTVLGEPSTSGNPSLTVVNTDEAKTSESNSGKVTDSTVEEVSDKPSGIIYMLQRNCHGLRLENLFNRTNMVKKLFCGCSGF